MFSKKFKQTVLVMGIIYMNEQPYFLHKGDDLL